MIKPLRDIVFLRPEKMATGILLTGKQEYYVGEVVAVGPGKHHKLPSGQEVFIPTELKPGQRVHYEWCAGNTVRVGDEDLVYLTEQNVSALVDDDVKMGETRKGNGGVEIWN